MKEPYNAKKNISSKQACNNLFMLTALINDIYKKETSTKNAAHTFWRNLFRLFWISTLEIFNLKFNNKLLLCKCVRLYVRDRRKEKITQNKT